jgi:hypothetical protein
MPTSSYQRYQCQPAFFAPSKNPMREQNRIVLFILGLAVAGEVSMADFAPDA